MELRLQARSLELTRTDRTLDELGYYLLAGAGGEGPATLMDEARRGEELGFGTAFISAPTDVIPALKNGGKSALDATWASTNPGTMNFPLMLIVSKPSGTEADGPTAVKTPFSITITDVVPSTSFAPTRAFFGASDFDPQPANSNMRSNSGFMRH